MDLCGYRGCLIADTDGIYDPATPNGRLLLGLKGQLSELELHTIRNRLTAGLLSKAQRGELALPLPIGLVRPAQGAVHKDPNLEIQHRLSLIFSLFLELGSASKVVRTFNEQQLRLPRRDRFGDVVWRRASVSAILSIVKNPAYAGAFVYGRSRTRRSADGQISTQRLPIEAWKIVVKDTYPAYISWSTFEKIQAMLKDNWAEYDRNKTRGLPRDGAALLHGLVYCGECGHKMVVQYKGAPRYLCNYLRQQYQTPVCQYIPAEAVDTRVVEAFLEALSPIELDAYRRALQAEEQRTAQVDRARRQQLQRLRYQAELARRQFDRVDPENRLVAAELERRWEAALRELRRTEEAYHALQAAVAVELPPELEQAFRALGEKLPRLWETGYVPTRMKKALLRCLIDKVVVHRRSRDELQARIVWRGGATTTLQIPIPVGSFAELSFAPAMEARIVGLSQAGCHDEEIAEQLTRLGYRSPLRSQVLPSTVKTIRLKHRIFQKRSQSHPRRMAGSWTVPQLARQLGVVPHWFYDRIYKGQIQVEKDARYGLYLFPDTAETLEQLSKLKRGEVETVTFRTPASGERS